jgi:4-hydroxybenzoate polyprenyltransferase
MKLVNVIPLPEIFFWLALCSIILVTASGYIVNDIFDEKADEINKPNKTFVGKTISKNSAWRYYTTLNVVAIVLSYFVSTIFFFIVISTSVTLFIYALFVKRIAIFGNVLVAFLSAIIPFLTVWLDVSYAFKMNPDEGYFSLYSFPLYVSAIAFLGSFAREIIKDMEDVEGDKVIKALTLPIILNYRKSEYIAIFLLIVCSILIFIYPPFTSNIFLMIYFALVVITPIIMTMKSIYKATEKEHYTKASNYLKIAMLGVIIFVWINRFLQYA